MQFMMRLAPITFPIAMLAGLGWCIGIALLEQHHGIGYALTRHCLMVFVVLAPWLMLKLIFYVIVSLGRKLGLIPPARPTHSLGYEESLYWFRVLAFFDGKRSRMPKRPIRRN
ncbi:TPA: hypothetical protein ACGRPM_002797 [Proteus mirabilis]|jgi:hypothetical protein|uniref:hypothetical protein n=1 Tax=Proteus mirabilis TaxID=584 RepID=UPI000C56938C|nr:hypothetical protein [Proteus mirabilis]EII5634346.1 hypothetical protein [Vibrio cholerae]MBL53090.1 hypothetical protein [Alteromonadaceae bacterium]MCA7214076.1 hypothetical protein [Escherichia coli]KAB7726775.1 hypothetical protein GBN10_09235 [Proteus mirabilis]MBS3869950.1 hypothetical protein [Proteus mirabilis]|tara:strand:+ start:98 stop:436 length:339 start_codon:yes stop_codon:yes gene_type:complete